MRRAAIAAVGLGLVWTAIGLGQTPAAEGDFPSRMERTLKQVADYQVMGDLVTPVALADLVNSTHGKPAERRQLADRLAGLLASPAPAAAKELACRQLSLIGSGEHVPALAALLTDEKLSHMARFALERIPDKKAGVALRQALTKTDKKLRVGVICSLGVRRDAEALQPLAETLTGADVDAAVAAAKALGRIGGPAATATLCRTLKASQGAVHAAVAEACLLAAETADKPQQRLAVYDLLRTADVPRPVRRAAIRGAILASQAAGVSLLVEQLQAADGDLFALGLRVLRELPSGEVTKASAAVLARLPAERQVRLIQALAERDDKAAAPAVVALAANGDVTVRAAAIQALARLGNAAQVPMLVQAATGATSELVGPATTTLANMPGKPVDAALVALVAHPDAKTRRLVIVALGERRRESALPALFQAAADGESSVRLAAIKALGNTARLADMGRLAELLLKTPAAAQRTAVEEAIASAAAGMSDKDACADKLLTLLPQADAEGRSALLRTLSQVGGPKALHAVSAAVGDANPELQDVAVRALSNWTTAEAADQLAHIARGSSNRKHKILALRGYIRLIGLPEVEPQEKLRRSDLAMEMADRDDERRLVLGALGNVGTQQALDRVLSYLDQPTLKNEAAAAALANSYKLVRSNPAVVAQAMKRVIASVDNKNIQRRAQELMNRCK
jgi:HEAT repeat protein